jgi:tetratricopeptide (TPR) repeat protein
MTPNAGPQPGGDAFFKKGLSLAKRGRWKEALAAYRESLRSDPDNPQTHLNMGFVYYEMGYDQDAQQAFERAKKLQARACRAR